MIKKRLSHVQIIGLGFFIIIIAGTLLLMLPISSASGNPAPFTTAFFTAVSSSCVTGLVAADTATYWSLFGQIVIILLIQIGGLGFMTVAVLFTMIVKRRLGLRQREVMVESINLEQINGILPLTKKIIAGTLIFEGTGAVLLSIKFVPIFGAKGIFYGIFHSISAFCNAGFDLMGTYSGEFSSFTAFADDTLIVLTLCFLIITGGIGFLVWDDISKNKLRFKKYSLNTKIVLATSAILIFGGWVLFFFFEPDYPLKKRILTALFNSVTPRTAGFNTVDTASLSGASKLLTMALMFIGGSSGSTAGGIKTTTVAVIFLHTVSGIRRHKCTYVFDRKIDDGLLKKAIHVMFVNLFLSLAGAVAICAMQNFEATDVMFETVSAISTVGMSTGITRDLCAASKYITAFLMFAGRVGSVSFASALFEKKKEPAVTYPPEKINIG